MEKACYVFLFTNFQNISLACSKSDQYVILQHCHKLMNLNIFDLFQIITDIILIDAQIALSLAKNTFWLLKTFHISLVVLEFFLATWCEQVFHSHLLIFLPWT